MSCLIYLLLGSQDVVPEKNKHHYSFPGLLTYETPGTLRGPFPAPTTLES